MKKDAPVDHEAAIVINARPGDKVEKGDLLATLYTNDPHSMDEAAELIRSAYSVSGEKPEKEALIHKLIS